jgi:hypothetical protein
MSKDARYTVKIKKPDQATLEAAIKNMVEAMNVEVLTEKTFHIYQQNINKQGVCIKLPGAAYPVDVYIENGQIKIRGDSMDMRMANEVIEQYYKITYMQQQIQTLGPSLNSLNMHMSQNEENDKARLEVSWF